MGYQSFDGVNGDSKSQKKLEKILLPDVLDGKSLLDVGCNEGFFCEAAIKRGAKKVVGIDFNAEIIDKAKNRVPEAEFINSSWYNLPNEKFDYIIFLSAIHYEENQKKLLDYMVSRLTPNGTLILECGVVLGADAIDWRLVQRHDGMLRFPSFRYLTEELLSRYAVRDVGRSVDQSGDPVPRYVFHCKPLQPTILLVGGASKSGKTVFSRLLSRQGIRTIHTDFLLGKLKREESYVHPISDFIRESLVENEVEMFVKKLTEGGRERDFCDMILRHVSKSDDMTVLEGYAFGQKEIVQTLTEMGSASGFRVVSAAL
ncbi:MAG: class I SAM-dependent methyltransferase [Nisaea sp.]|uniref:class I SAM-dependent methyltransferase n=1 Tax=Nisaea sp. TaxID=2024842 RepID=UPI001B2073A9|nr:class I SAM-dependent methyltransferase [Nisaea sp.]MBO6560811.1 class I SAM-dependent methyltransferase [Nisaea sp.]